MAAMTVRQLIEKLGEFDKDAIVVLSSDGEGNSFSPMPDDGFYSIGEENSWSGSFRSEDEEEDEEEEEDEYEFPTKGVSCIVLWPTN